MSMLNRMELFFWEVFPKGPYTNIYISLILPQHSDCKLLVSPVNIFGKDLIRVKDLTFHARCVPRKVPTFEQKFIFLSALGSVNISLQLQLFMES